MNNSIQNSTQNFVRRIRVLCAYIRLRSGILMAGIPAMAGCSLGLTDVPDPSTIVNESVVRSQEGAIGLYRGAASQFAAVFAGGMNNTSGWSFAFTSGLAADEYTALTQNASRAYNLRMVEPNSPLGTVAQPYNDLHTTRAALGEAIAALQKYGVTTPPSYIGQLLAFKGYIYLMFAEMYCSGVPLSEIVPGGNIVYGQPQTTEAILNSAVVLFDSAIATATDSAHIRQLAMIGKARALLNLGKFAEAAAVVTTQNVPTNFLYRMRYSTNYPNYLASATGPNVFFMETSMVDRAGTNGLDYVSAGNSVGKPADPRVAWFLVMGSPIPSKYRTPADPVALANGIEARLIEAEAALKAQQVTTWRDILNTLRKSALADSISSLSNDSTMAASDTLRENVMFRERAFWLFGTGHRMGDMRRLVRQYRRGVETVFPMGLHAVLPSPYNVYSGETTFQPPLDEIDNNPYYKGCLSHDA